MSDKNGNLEDCKATYREEMQKLAVKREMYNKRRMQFEERKAKFAPIIEKSRSRLKKMHVKNEQERRENKVRDDEIECLKQQIEEAKVRLSKLTKQIRYLQPCGDFLTRVIRCVEAGNVPSITDEKRQSLCMRFRGLTEAGQQLYKKDKVVQGQVKTEQQDLDKLIESYKTELIVIGGEVKKAQKDLDEKRADNLALEGKMRKHDSTINTKLQRAAEVALALNGLSEKCRHETDPPVPQMTNEQKIKLIKEWIDLHRRVYDKVTAQSENKPEEIDEKNSKADSSSESEESYLDDSVLGP